MFQLLQAFDLAAQFGPGPGQALLHRPELLAQRVHSLHGLLTRLGQFRAGGAIGQVSLERGQFGRALRASLVVLPQIPATGTAGTQDQHECQKRQEQREPGDAAGTPGRRRNRLGGFHRIALRGHPAGLFGRAGRLKQVREYR